MNEPYPDGSLSHLYDSASNREETRLGLSVPIPMPDGVFLDAVLLKPGTSDSAMCPQLGRPSLDTLLAQVTQDNIHSATEWGHDVGQEVTPF